MIGRFCDKNLTDCNVDDLARDNPYQYKICHYNWAEIWSLDEPTTNCNYMAQNSKSNKKREWKTVHLLVCVFKETSKKNLMIN